MKALLGRLVVAIVTITVFTLLGFSAALWWFENYECTSGATDCGIGALYAGGGGLCGLVLGVIVALVMDWRNTR